MTYKRYLAGLLAAILLLSVALFPACRKPQSDDGEKSDVIASWDASASQDNSVRALLHCPDETKTEYTLQITGTGSMADYTAESPAPWNSYGENIVAVQVDSGVTRVGAYAFSTYSGITEVRLGDTVETIGAYAFADCWALSSVTFSERITLIDAYAFYRCVALETLILPKALGTVGEYAFCECSGLTSVVLPDGLETVGDYAFQKCKNLTEVVAPQSISMIGLYSFSGTAYYLSEEIWTDGMLYIGGCLLRVKPSDCTEYTVREGIRTIGTSAFADCAETLVSVTIPADVTRICTDAFNVCRRMTDIYFLGTKAQWLAIEKEENWNRRTKKYVIHCTDGDLSKTEG